MQNYYKAVLVSTWKISKGGADKYAPGLYSYRISVNRKV